MSSSSSNFSNNNNNGMRPDGSRVFSVDPNFLKCGICQELYRDPRRLPCGHCYCAECLQRLRDSNGMGCLIRCPECNQVHREPVERLLVDQYIKSMVANVLLMNGGQMSQELDEFQIFVKGLKGENHVFNVNKQTTVGELKQKICERIGTPPNGMFLHSQSKPMQRDEASLGEYNVVKNSTVHMTIRCLGGKWTGSIY